MPCLLFISTLSRKSVSIEISHDDMKIEKKLNCPWFRLRESIKQIDNFESIEAFLDNSPELMNLVDSNGRTVLHYAYEADNLIWSICISERIRNPADECVKDKYGESPLKIALKMNKMNVIKLNLGKKILNFINCGNFTCAKEKVTEVFNHYYKVICPQQLISNFIELLHIAIVTELDSGVLELLLSIFILNKNINKSIPSVVKPINIEEKVNFIFDFYSAIRLRDSRKILSLIKRNSALSKMDRINWQNDFISISLAVTTNYCSLVKFLIKHGGNVNLATFGENTVLHVAVEQEHRLDLVKLLVAYNVDMTAVNLCKRNALLQCLYSKHYDMIDYLIMETDNIEQVDSYYESVLSLNYDHDSSSDNIKNILDLIKKRCSIEIYTEDLNCLNLFLIKLTKLQNVHSSAIHLLREYGANLNVADILGYSPLAHAINDSNYNLVLDLLIYGTKISKVNIPGVIVKLMVDDQENSTYLDSMKLNNKIPHNLDKLYHTPFEFALSKHQQTVCPNLFVRSMNICEIILLFMVIYDIELDIQNNDYENHFQKYYENCLMEREMLRNTKFKYREKYDLTFWDILKMNSVFLLRASLLRTATELSEMLPCVPKYSKIFNRKQQLLQNNNF